MRKGRSWKGKHLQVRVLTGAPRHPSVRADRAAVYVGTVISAKLEKSAVKRNRMRRRCREALRLAVQKRQQSGAPFSNIQLLLLPRSSSLTCDFSDIQNDIETLLSSLLPHAQQ